MRSVLTAMALLLLSACGEKSAQHGKKLDTLLMEVVNLLGNDTPPSGVSTILYPVNGAIIGNSSASIFL